MSQSRRQGIGSWVIPGIIWVSSFLVGLQSNNFLIWFTCSAFFLSLCAIFLVLLYQLPSILKKRYTEDAFDEMRFDFDGRYVIAMDETSRPRRYRFQKTYCSRDDDRPVI